MLAILRQYGVAAKGLERLPYCGKPQGEQQAAGGHRREAAERGGLKSESEEGGENGGKKAPTSWR